MTVKIVTDSSADLPDELVKELGITVVPLYVRFEDEVLRDRVDISEDDFYQRLTEGPIHPNTTQPSPQDFVDVYRKLAKSADGIVSIHLSAKLSGTCSSALQAKGVVANECPVEVVDSETLSMALGLLVIAAARAAKEGKSLDEVEAVARETLPKIHLLALLDTLKYLLLGGRIGKAKALLGSLLSVKPILTLKDGEVVPGGQVRTRAKGMDRLFEFVENSKDIQELTVVHSTTPDEAEALAERLGSVFDKAKIIISRLGPVLGVHIGPAALIVAVREA
ncbi:MAG: DegV family protein [Dehalococcoidia bacterium]|jgi:DegV family protein with EDD domain